ncbi:hypothetical protein D3C75_791470 [compost metagenome]
MNFRSLVRNQIASYGEQPAGGNLQIIVHTDIVSDEQIALQYVQMGKLIVGYDFAYRHFFRHIHGYIGVDIHIALYQHPCGIDLQCAPVIGEGPRIQFPVHMKVQIIIELKSALHPQIAVSHPCLCLIYLHGQRGIRI